MEANKALILTLIQADLKHNQLVSGLQSIHLETDMYFLGLHEAVAQLMGIADEMPDGWAVQFDAQIEKWVREERKNREEAKRKIAAGLEERKMNLDKLLNGFLDGAIERDSYLRKKDELVKIKTELHQREKDLARGGIYWVEPLRNWLKTAVRAEKLASSNDFYAVKSFLEKIGSNRLLLDKKVLLDFAPPFDLIPLHKQKQATPPDRGRVACKGISARYAVEWAHQGSNLGPPDYESDALTG